MSQLLLFVLYGAATLSLTCAALYRHHSASRSRLSNLARRSAAYPFSHDVPEEAGVAPDDEARFSAELLLLDGRMQDRLGRAGGITPLRRRRVVQTLVLSTLSIAVMSVGACRALIESPRAVAVVVVIGVYGAALTVHLGLTLMQKRFEREAMFELPLFLDALTLLVESGLALVPALHRLVELRRSLGRADVVTVVFDTVRSLSDRGISFHEGLMLVSEGLTIPALHHALVHLDIASNEGAKLIPAMRALGDTTYGQWRMSVEGRVRRLENYSVFPVFGAVLGLMAILSAGPIVQLMALDDRMAPVPASGMLSAAPTGGAR